MRPDPPLPAAAMCSLALGQLAQSTPLAAMPAPGLWLLLDRFGMVAPFALLLPVLATGSIAAALAQPLAHGRATRPWAAAIAAAMLLAGSLLPLPVAIVIASLPFALVGGMGRRTILALLAGIVAPPGGVIALALALVRLIDVLRLPAAANDNQRIAIRAG